jgi:hypothetical protein
MAAINDRRVTRNLADFENFQGLRTENGFEDDLA